MKASAARSSAWRWVAQPLRTVAAPASGVTVAATQLSPVPTHWPNAIALC